MTLSKTPEEMNFGNEGITIDENVKGHSNVLVIYTGGTIGMKKGSRGYEPAPNYLAQKLLSIPQFHDNTQHPHTMPVSRFGKRIHYEIIEYEKLLDSSNMGIEEWVKIAKDVADNYSKFDAFVILHGTDTMSYTASALSFMLENLNKPVVLTGSQIPISVEPNDAVENLRGALTIAGHFEIPEVSLYFNNTLFRGNRSIKDDATSLDAFKSPNFPPLVSMGIDIRVAWEHVLSAPVDRNLILKTNFNPNIGVLKIFPAISVTIIKNFLLPPLKGCILETYGTGNAPDNRQDFLQALAEANSRGVVIVNVTQCSKGVVESNYATGKALADCGVISGHDLTTECALVKLSFLLGQNLSIEEVKSKMQQNLLGEMSVQSQDMYQSYKDTKFSKSMATLLKPPRMLGGPEDTKNEKTILSALLCTAASTGNLMQLKYLLANGADVNCCDYDGRSPLHLAVAEGHLPIVQFLVENHADINVKDRWQITPLTDAMRNGRVEIAKYLATRGATNANINTTVIPISKQELNENAFKKRAKKTVKDDHLKLPPLIKTRM